MRAGLRKHSLTIESKSVTRGALGVEVVTWVPLVTVKGRAKPVRGAEFFAAAQIHDEQIVVFTINYRAGIEETMRLTWNGQHYDIVSAINVGGANVDLEITGRKGVRDGR